MANLAIKGHPTRGKEVIEILEMLGANRLGYKDTFVGFYYYIECGAICSSDEYPTYATIFTLEEFLEKYPYKVGDEVEYKSIGDANLKSKIIYMEWCNSLNKVLYTTEDAQVISTEDITETKSIPPYMDYDIKEDKDIIEHTTEINLNHPCFDGHDKIELIIPENWKFEQRDNKIFGIRKYPQYPTTYEECCQVLMGKTDFQDFELVLTKYVINRSEENSISLCPPHISLINNFYKLLICRDAYWKIAGDWRPEFRFGKKKYCIMTKDNKVISATVEETNRIFVFPTEEMRDEFYKNFRDLIERCKKLL